MLKRVIGVMAAVAAALAGTACTTVISGDPAANCSWATATATAQQAASSDTVVLVDITASFWPKAGQQSQLPDDPVSVSVNALLQDFATAGTRLVSFGTFDGSSTTIDWKVSGAALPTPTGDNGSITGEKRNAATCLTGIVKSAVSAAPQAPGTDVMAALAAAGQQLQGSPAAGDRVVLITDGLSNTGCLNLSAVISKGKPASAIPGSCPERTGLASLHGIALQLDGIGFQAAQPALNTAEQAWVEGYWSELCAALGVRTPASCVAPAGVGTARTSTVAHLTDPGIVFPSVPKGATSVPIPADLLFAFDSSALSPAAQAYIGILAQQVKAQGRSIVKVIGYTDAVGSQSYNLGLSQRRAQAVVASLALDGFSHVTAVGAGESDPACSPQYTPAGAPIASCMAQDRRVQIILGG